jgi:tRNA(adenine34) deaminase
MQEAINQAKRAMTQGEVPIGAVIEYKNKIIAKAYNKVEKLKDPTAHAEILAIRKATKSINNWRLTDCTLYTTIEPCLMCIGAILQARIKNIYFGAYDKKQGALSYYGLKFDNLNIQGGLYEKECSELIQAFFKKLRG